MNTTIPELIGRAHVAAWDNIEIASRIAARNALNFFDARKPDEVEKYPGVTPATEIFRLDGLRVFRYEGKTDTSGKLPMLLVPALINRSYIMDLMPGSSLAGALREAGLPVYLLDWGLPGPQHDHLPFSYFIDDVISMASDAVVRDCCCKKATDSICRTSGCNKISLLGYCMGGTMSLLHAALHPDRIARLSLLATPVNFHDDGVLSKWSRKDVFDVDAICDTIGAMDPALLQTSFQLMKPLSQYQKLKGLYESCTDPKALDSYLHLDKWVNDNIHVPRETYREYVKMTYQDNALVNNKISLGGRAVDLKTFTSPVLNIMARKDHIVPAESSRMLSEMVGGEVSEVMIDAGHIGIAMGRKARDMFAAVAKFHCGDKVNSHCIID
ncbi:MAG: alpha/beta fold hydrolase [Candidatus Riflebacteria bacterium]|nr:alpha/beta fold hydrolase [Candidatus Riflebacteria bacterium]